MNVVLVFIPANGEGPFITIRNLFPDYEGSGLRQVSKPGNPTSTPDVIFVPETEAATTLGELAGILPREASVYAAYHLGAADGIETIKETISELEDSNKLDLTSKSFQRGPDLPLTKSIQGLAKAANQGGEKEYAEQLQALIDACGVDRSLEVKLALLHACLVPVPAGAPPLSPASMKTILERAGHLSPEVEKLSIAGRPFWNNKEIRETVLALREPGKFDGLDADYCTTLSSLRDLLLPDG